jgi:hypothetical protein
MTSEFQFERFLRAVHRRMVVLRALERLGLCILGGCAVALVLMPILIWRGQGTGELLAAVLGVSGVAGVGWGLASRPTKLAAAMEADRQLGWSDLLGTAWMLRRGRSEMERTVLAMAEARTARTAASAVVLNRLGVRGWGGIGLAGALVVGVSLFGGDPNRAAAARAATGPRSWQEIEAMPERGNAARTSASADYRRAKPGLGGDDDDPANSTSTTPDAASGSATSDAASKNGAGGAQEGTGAGAGQSASRAGGSKTGANPATGGDANANANGGRAGATSAGGGGTASGNTANGGGRSGSSAGANTARKAPPVWRGDGWPADQEAARAAIQAGRVPDSYREMVREYFERE